VIASVAVMNSTTLLEDLFPRQQVLNDSTATVVAAGEKMEKHLFVNGVGMTGLTPITKMMVHFPVAHVAAQTKLPLDGLIICFGMGTSFRSLVAWGGNVTAVELIPSVPKLFGFYFADGPDLLRSGADRIRIEIDDGRRYLDRTRSTFDIISLDPPPPIEAAASSLLYSKQFYQSALPRLRPNGILQAWLPAGDRATLFGVTQALLESFPHVRAFRSVKGWGIHFLASRNPIPRLTAEQMLALMPPAAVRDMTEWENVAPLEYLKHMVSAEVEPRRLLAEAGGDGKIAISDDRPVNEFFFLRRYVAGQQ
jgi:spermidine synthase